MLAIQKGERPKLTDLERLVDNDFFLEHLNTFLSQCWSQDESSRPVATQAKYFLLYLRDEGLSSL